jgi:hypothetical protein
LDLMYWSLRSSTAARPFSLWYFLTTCRMQRHVNTALNRCGSHVLMYAARSPLAVSCRP